MSYQSMTVNNQQPNQTGDIALNLSNLITVVSPTQNQVLKKAASDWATGALTTSAAPIADHFYPNNSYGTGGSTYSQGDYYILRKTSNEFHVENEVTLPQARSTYSPVTTTSWLQEFGFTAANYPAGAVVLFRAVPGPNMPSGGKVAIQWRSSAANQSYANSSPIGNVAHIDDTYGSTAYGVYVSTGSTFYVGLRVVSLSGSIRLVAPTQSIFQQVTIKRLN